MNLIRLWFSSEFGVYVLLHRVNGQPDVRTEVPVEGFQNQVNRLIELSDNVIGPLTAEITNPTQEAVDIFNAIKEAASQ